VSTTNGKVEVDVGGASVNVAEGVGESMGAKAGSVTGNGVHVGGIGVDSGPVGWKTISDDQEVILVVPSMAVDAMI